MAPEMAQDRAGLGWGECSAALPPGDGGIPESRRSFYESRVSLGPHRPAFEVQAVKVVPVTPTVAVLIGRDILKQGALLFDGQNETLSFWF
jgi:hypothetical protein